MPPLVIIISHKGRAAGTILSAIAVAIRPPSVCLLTVRPQSNVRPPSAVRPRCVRRLSASVRCPPSAVLPASVCPPSAVPHPSASRPASSAEACAICRGIFYEILVPIRHKRELPRSGNGRVGCPSLRNLQLLVARALRTGPWAGAGHRGEVCGGFPYCFPEDTTSRRCSRGSGRPEVRAAGPVRSGLPSDALGNPQQVSQNPAR